ncbi:mechanosensitive ion channel protein MscS [Couchioplanes caeruleus subsp. caeruleus]|uniref:Mechanosensitive ion channel protein MscS n=2 Tax=Couchioplanes caeruleus TaxID=56438 RepID=A0A1K0GVU9_9ACTN|nr:mechanosensitive ion channel protein MscS [Couchioplanes caeruleus subsp. caeruleus]
MVLASGSLGDLVNWLRSSGLEIVLFITGSVLLARYVRWMAYRITRRIDVTSSAGDGLVRSENAKHSHVLTQVITWSMIVLIYCVTVISVISRLGVPITGLVAPAAVVGVAVGFGAQRLVQDILAGLFIIVERQYGFGDVVRISALGKEDGISGTVEEVSLRVTRLRTVSGEVVIVANGQIVQVTNMSRDWARAIVDVPVPWSADINLVREILHRVSEEVTVDDDLGKLLLDAPSVVGVERMELDTLHVRVVARTLPGKQFEVGRELRERVAVAFLAENIAVAPGLGTAEPMGMS